MRKCETGANLIEKRFLAISAVLAIGADLDALQKECNGGNGASCYELGVLHDNAREGASQDYQKAAELYSKACNLGKGAGCSNLGFLYDNGSGVKQDYAKASEFYAKACDMGSGGGCYDLGLSIRARTRHQRGRKRSRKIPQKRVRNEAQASLRPL